MPYGEQQPTKKRPIIDPKPEDNAFAQCENARYQYWEADVSSVIRQYRTLEIFNPKETYIDVMSNAEDYALTQKLEQAAESGKSIFVIFNKENHHWTAFCILRDTNDSVILLYKDSYGGKPPQELIDTIINTFGRPNNIAIQIHRQREQTHSVNCGIFALENLRIIASKLHADRNNLIDTFESINETHFCTENKANMLKQSEFSRYRVLGECAMITGDGRGGLIIEQLYANLGVEADEAKKQEIQQILERHAINWQAQNSAFAEDETISVETTNLRQANPKETDNLNQRLTQQARQLENVSMQLEQLNVENRKLRKRLDRAPTPVQTLNSCNPLRFLPSDALQQSHSQTVVDQKDIRKFLTFVAEGEQAKAEVMSKNNQNLALVSGDVVDLSKRIFIGITGFQYAVWALDWRMWTMIKKYLSNEAAREQAEGFKTGAWVKSHGVHAQSLLDNLVQALQITIDLYRDSKNEEGNKAWVEEVGGAQFLLPAHVVNEYCYYGRSFSPVPNFMNALAFSRSRTFDEGEWFTASYNGGRLGDKFAIYRGSRDTAVGRDGCGAGIGWSRMSDGMKFDQECIHTLSSCRTTQREALIRELELNARFFANFKEQLGDCDGTKNAQSYKQQDWKERLLAADQLYTKAKTKLALHKNEDANVLFLQAKDAYKIVKTKNIEQDDKTKAEKRFNKIKDGKYSAAVILNNKLDCH